MEKIHQKTVVMQVMDRIKDLIASGEYPVNERIPTESELAQMFGVGRSSVREAVKIFQHLGVLEARVPKGTFVCDRSKISQEAITWSILLGQDSLDEIIELRHLIERAGVEALVTEIAKRSPSGAELVERLRVVLARMEVGAASTSIEELVQADYDFHATIIEASSNALFDAIYGTLHAFMREEIRRTYFAIADLTEIVADHREILDSLLSGEPSRALVRHGDHFTRIRRLLQEAQGGPAARPEEKSSPGEG